MMQDMSTVCAKMYHRLRKHFDRTRWNSYEIVFVPVQYRYQIGARFAPNVTLAKKSFWTLLLVHLGDKAQV
jgi:hypothetical protein